MPYCITLRSRPDRRLVTGWYDGSNCRWSTDHKRKKLFDKKRDAKPVRRDLRNLCPRNAELINIEPANVGFGVREDVFSPVSGGLSNDNAQNFWLNRRFAFLISEVNNIH